MITSPGLQPALVVNVLRLVTHTHTHGSQPEAYPSFIGWPWHLCVCVSVVFVSLASLSSHRRARRQKPFPGHVYCVSAPKPLKQQQNPSPKTLPSHNHHREGARKCRSGVCRLSGPARITFPAACRRCDCKLCCFFLPFLSLASSGPWPPQKP